MIKLFSKLFLICILSQLSANCRKEISKQPDALNNTDDKSFSDPVFKVADVLGNNMVLQRDKPVSIWGSAPAGDSIEIKATWYKITLFAVSDENNNWRIFIPASPVNTVPQQLTIRDNNANTVTFKNILLGDVWVCSGQSNMDYPVDSVSGWPGYEGVVNRRKEIADAKWPGLRLLDIKADYKKYPVNNISTEANWSVCNPETVKLFSAVAYFFGRKIMTTLRVPIGLVVSSQGGSSCQAWTNKETIQSDPVLNSYYWGTLNSSQLYNGMINPLKYMSVNGFIWYQGETNRFDTPSVNYTRLNAAMINAWRKKFNQGDLPFFFVQLPPYDAYFLSGNEPSKDYYGFFREAQANVRNTTNNTGMAVTMDVNDIHRIHPKDKKPVGERLGLLALKQTYGLDIQAAGPQYKSYIQSGNKVIINFVAGTATGLTTKDNELIRQHFIVAGADKSFVHANATICNDKTKILLTIPSGISVKSVRYAFGNYQVTNLQNDVGLPMEPFRTDNWKQSNVIYYP